MDDMHTEEAEVGTLERCAADAILSIKLLGKFSVCVNDEDIQLPSRKARALIGYLALSEPQEQTRERLVGLFWSESATERARASLRQTLHELRNAFEPSGFSGL